MTRFFLIAIASVCMLFSCARMEKRGAHYNPEQCPFCVNNPGVCDNCHQTGKCGFCNGTGTRKTTTAGLTDEKIKTIAYTEKCPFCNGTGVCKYCKGKGKCSHCKGTARVDSWDFYENESQNKADAGLPETK